MLSEFNNFYLKKYFLGSSLPVVLYAVSFKSCSILLTGSTIGSAEKNTLNSEYIDEQCYFHNKSKQ